MFETLNYFIAFISSRCVSLWAQLESFLDLSSAQFDELICFIAPTSVCVLFVEHNTTDSSVVVVAPPLLALANWSMKLSVCCTTNND